MQLRVDVLVVVEDSPAMASFQPFVADNLASTGFISVGWNERERLDTRIAVVTTTAGPDGYGSFVAPCDDPSLPAPRPTVAQPGQPPALHPWVDTTRGNATYPSEDDRARAIGCLGARGSSGSRFPAPVAAVRGALRRMADPSDPAHDFRRLGAPMWIVFIAAGHDCSFVTGEPPDPDGPPAQCWTAGVTCEGEVCVPSDSGGLASVEATVAELSELEAQIQAERGADFPRLLVSLVGGVGSDGSMVARPSGDDAFNATWGIGPGCANAVGPALPPVRLAAIADAFQHWDEPTRWSLCESSWDLRRVFKRLAYIQIHCMPECAAGAAPGSTEPLDCSVHLDGFDDRGPVTVPIPECADEVSPGVDGPCRESRDDDPFAEECADDGTRPFRLVYSGETSLPSGPSTRPALATRAAAEVGPSTWC